MSEQESLNLKDDNKVDSIEKYKFEPIKGYPMLHWHGKRPFTSTQYYPAQKKEVYGEEVDGWINKIFWGDNLQVMSHLVKEYRGKVDLIYIDPPFDSKADYKKRISLKNKTVMNDSSVFEEKQYTDIWTNDEYLQFIYERLILLRELLSEKGTIYLHCDNHKSHYLRCILDEVFGSNNFINEIIWKRRGGALNNFKSFGSVTDTIYVYSKSQDYTFNAFKTKDTPEAQQYIKERFVYDDGDGDLYSRDPVTNPASTPTPSLIYEYKGYKPPQKGWAFSKETMKKWDEEGRLYFPENKEQRIRRKTFLREYEGQPIQNIWADIYVINSQAKESVGYPTQKPEDLLSRIIRTSSNPGDLVLDVFCGSGTTQAVSLGLGRRFIGADINLGAIQTSINRLVKLSKNAEPENNDHPLYTGVEVYNVNNYDIFRNPIEAKKLLLEALEIEEISGSIYDGEKDGHMVKVMPVNRMATREDLNELISNFPYKVFEQRKEENPNKAVESVILICMGHEPNLKAHLEQECGYKLNVEVIDILRDKSNIEFKRDAEAFIELNDNKLKIINYFPMNLMQKLSLQKESISEWRELVDQIVIDWNYGGAAMEPTINDMPENNNFVKGIYDIPEDAGTIKIKIIDLLSESYEEVIKHG